MFLSGGVESFYIIDPLRLNGADLILTRPLTLDWLYYQHMFLPNQQGLLTAQHVRNLALAAHLTPREFLNRLLYPLSLALRPQPPSSRPVYGIGS